MRLLLLLSALLAPLAAPLAAQSTDAASTKKAKPPEPPSPFYDSLAPVALELRANLGVLRRDKEDKAPWRPASLGVAGPDGAMRHTPIRARTRGIWRLRNCDFPPLRLDLARKQFRGTLLEGVNKPKLVSVCRNDPTSEQYLLQEYQLYRIYQLLTPISHRARLARIAYVDSASGKPFMTRWAILLEEPEAMADRLGMQVVEEKGARAEDLEPATAAIVGLFQYLIANTDWSLGGLHNGELLLPKEGSGLPYVHYPVVYDFDYAGAINAKYAAPSPIVRISSVRQRLFRGTCVPAEEWTKAFALFNAKRDAIRALYAPTDPVGALLDRRTAESTLSYYDEFYDVINDPKKARDRIMEACLEGN